MPSQEEIRFIIKFQEQNASVLNDISSAIKKMANDAAPLAKNLKAVNAQMRALDGLEKKAKGAADGMEKAAASSKRMGAAQKTVSAAVERTNAAAKKLAPALNDARMAQDQLSKSANGVARVFRDLWSVYLGVMASFKAFQGISRLVEEFSKVETAVIGVAKTTGLMGRDLKGLERNLENLSMKIPVSTTKLLEFSKVAGQLGVRGTKNLEIFAETMAKMEVATDVVGEEGALAMTRMLNVMKEGPDEIKRLASVIVELGNTSAATEKEIVKIGTRVALATARFKIGTTEAVAIGTAMKEMGIEAELGGTAVSRVFTAMDSAMREGGDKMKAFT